MVRIFVRKKQKVQRGAVTYMKNSYLNYTPNLILSVAKLKGVRRLEYFVRM